MCKHIMINDFRPSDLDTLSQFVDLTYDRDGYGAILRTKSNALETIKSLDSGSFYLTLTRRVLQGDIQTVVVHHRTSTNGRGIEYAHPFEYQGVYMTHNGVVTVPGKHETKTTNDTEALLHHLIKTNFDTLAVQGYYSCFILDDHNTAVLVDDCAPMHTDGRVYSSHKLGESWTKLDKVMLFLDPATGTPTHTYPIEVSQSTYGQDKRIYPSGL